ncbi:SHOCT domain-containing protein [Candidatus Woesearchaeota archaeon]|nr:SHOCT domain-containing protein [Candidatus Woesearchaeota archaeon]HIH38326.1 SHOCT domain-containing protein [Candidatus Woesearchaeota archaeon]HIJ03282.1 SHOCT domain-containing protein [Candidatus Woesearchaeota archaeon]
MMGAGMGFGFVFMLLFWALLIWIVVLLVNAYQPDKEEPLTTLKKRYASGKISKKEFEKMKKEVR